MFRLPKKDGRFLRRGFTLIELLVVLVILALLAGIVLPRFLSRAGDANISAAKTQISSFKTALELYAVDNNGFPSSQEGLAALFSAPSTATNWKGPYLKDVMTVPKDPWGNEYIYQSPGANPGQDYFIQTLGKDGKPGGDGENADLDSTQMGKQ